MGFKIVQSRRADNEVYDILEYFLEEWNSKIANDFLDDLEKALSLITIAPFSFPIVEQSNQVRKFLLKPYHRIFDTVREDEIIIISIFDMRQDPDKLKSILEQW